MKRLLFLIPLIAILGCASPRIYTPKPVRPYKPKVIKPYKPKEDQQYKEDNVFDAPFANVWSATLAGIEWMKWIPAFTDESNGIIRLKEAYVYRRSGKLLRIYTWPPRDKLEQSRIDDYLEKVSDYPRSFDWDRPIFSQESMQIRVIRLSETKTKVAIDYKIRPYLYSGKFEDGTKSNGYIESVLLEKIEENLKGGPLAGKQFR
ncbi:MAG TPA: hypothetical protein VGA94_03485 [Thermodesulfobacteriota bacterium]